MRLYGLGATAFGLMAAAFIACTGDDPEAAAPPPSGTDAGDTGSSGNPADGSSGGTDGGGMTDAAIDGPRCDKAKAFGDPKVITGVLNTADKNELGFTMTDDELIAIIAQDGELLYTTRKSRDVAFDPPTKDFLLQVDTVGQESSPSLSPDAKTLYFTRDGNLMVAHRDNIVDSFGTPELVLADDAGVENVESTKINRTGARLHWTSSEDAPTLIADRTGSGYASFIQARPLAGPLASIAFSGDELTLYFTVPEDGGYVMKSATRTTPSTALGTQQDMPANLRSFDALHVTSDDCIIYVRSTKGSDAGKYDIWEARRPQ